MGGYRASFLPGFGLRADYALCDYDITHVGHISGGYELPIGQGRALLRTATGVVNQIAGGRQVNSIVTPQGGQPTTIPCPVATTAGFGCYAFLVPGQGSVCRPQQRKSLLESGGLRPTSRRHDQHAGFQPARHRRTFRLRRRSTRRDGFHQRQQFWQDHIHARRSV